MSDKEDPPSVYSEEPHPSVPVNKAEPPGFQMEAKRSQSINLGGIHVSIHHHSSPDEPEKSPEGGKGRNRELNRIERLLSDLIHASKGPQTDSAKIRLHELSNEQIKLNRERIDNSIRAMRSVADDVAPFLVGWKRDLVRRVLKQNIDLNESDCQQVYQTNFDSSYIHKDIKEAAGRLEVLLLRLGKSRLDDFLLATENEVEQLFRQLTGKTSWEEFDQLSEKAKINYADFHQVLDGVLNGLVTNCFLDVNDRSRLPIFAIKVNSPGSPVRIGVRFIEDLAYIDYRGHIKRISSFESSTDTATARIHVEGPWRRSEAEAMGVVHDIGPIEVAGPKSLARVAHEMSNMSGLSERTIGGWRREFCTILSTFDLWFSWRKVHTTCEILRCNGGRMVITTKTLTFTRNLGATISKDAALEASQEEAVSDSSDRRLSFDELPAIIGAKVPPESIEGVGDDEIARALYISSSWFSTVGPRAAPDCDCAWGNTMINNNVDDSEEVSWIPTTREIIMAGWKLTPYVKTPTGRNWGKMRTECNGNWSEDEEGRIRCHLANGQCFGPENEDGLEHCVWGSAQQPSGHMTE